MKRIIVFLAMVAIVAAMALPAAEAASSLISIEFVDFVVYNNGCAAGQSVYVGYWVVEGVPDGGTYQVTEHFSGVGGSRTVLVNLQDATLGTMRDLGPTFNGTGWTAPGDSPQVYFEATAGGTTVTTPVITIDCATGTYTGWPAKTGGNAPAPVVEAPPEPGPDMVAMPAWSVVGTFVTATPLYWSPETGAVSDAVMVAGKSLWVTGLSADGQFYQVVLSGIFLWVPVETMGPTYDDLWNGWPLPTEVVE